LRLGVSFGGASVHVLLVKFKSLFLESVLLLERTEKEGGRGFGSRAGLYMGHGVHSEPTDLRQRSKFRKKVLYYPGARGHWI
jgi:hypothetical protein